MRHTGLILSWLLLVRATMRMQLGTDAQTALVEVAEEVAVVVAPTEGIGMGVFAAHDILSGTWVCHYRGELLTDDDVDRLYPGASNEALYLFAVGDDLVIDAHNSTHHSRYINHAQDGNLVAKPSKVKGQYIDLIANRDIPKGEE